MKRFALTAAAAAMAAAAGGFAGNASADTELVIVSWGGAYSASQQNAYHDPYMKNNPEVSIVNDDSSSEAVAKLRAMNEAGNVTWDLVDVVAADAIRLCDEGLAKPIDHDAVLAPAPDGTPASEDFGDLIVSECFIPQIVYSTTWGYRHDMLDKEPTSVCDVFDLQNFPGKRSMEKNPINNMEWALICDGVDPANVYDVLGTREGVERALAKLDTIKDSVVWWTKGAQPPQLLADGEVVMASAYNGRLFAAIEEQKQPIKMLWDWQVFDLDGWIVPTGGDNEAEVMEYLKFATDTQRLADQAKYISYGPARKSSAPLVGDHAELGIPMGPHMPTDPENSKTTLLYNYEFWADNRDDIDERFQAWLLE
ncbi:extracellular solute-binding protein [Minwuia thermotolerans]|uniref:Spermidine/putrescine ABC transporter substrate-binding protein n=1 Tax=Minwuia thermotolerans TaxID=2056226 RepID=A0A2M9G5Z9_9PROT|nr:extracellular solute-binding protein [Minwuia thermotolerans]PJK31145.1 spermidine/putrescine ABC transporter substrate-binding protein [Minwuia thermotolerans]